MVIGNYHCNYKGMSIVPLGISEIVKRVTYHSLQMPFINATIN